MGTAAQALVLVSMTPVAQTVAIVMVVKVKMESLVVRLAAGLVQGVPWLPPHVVNHFQMPPKSDPSAHAAYMLQEWQACTAQAQQNAQQSAGSVPLPPESCAVPPPPPVYGAPPSGTG